MSGFTSGKCNDFESYINKLLLRWLEGKTANISKQKEISSKELVIINSKQGLFYASFQDHFSESGAFGSLIMDSKGNVAGVPSGSLYGEAY